MNETARKYLDELFRLKCLSITSLDEEGNPETRIINSMMVSDEGLFIICCKGKPFYSQLKEGKKVAIAAFDASNSGAIRLQGSVVQVFGEKRQEVLDFMRVHRSGFFELYDGEALEIVACFLVDKAEGEFYHLTDKPIFRESFAYGGAKEKEQGFVIDEKCISCGLCKEKCPGLCIQEGEPYFISRAHCLQCGLCERLCPQGAIVRLHGRS